MSPESEAHSPPFDFGLDVDAMRELLLEITFHGEQFTGYQINAVCDGLTPVGLIFLLDDEGALAVSGIEGDGGDRASYQFLFIVRVLPNTRVSVGVSVDQDSVGRFVEYLEAVDKSEQFGQSGEILHVVRGDWILLVVAVPFCPMLSEVRLLASLPSCFPE